MNRFPITRSTRARRLCAAALLLALTAAHDSRASEPAAPAKAPAHGNWNGEAIAWLGFLEGMEAIEQTGRPGLIVFYTDWCPHCKHYSWQFHDPEVVRLARRFVMIRVNRDEEPGINELYGEHGTYVPRTLFVAPDRSVDWSLRGANRHHPYFLDQHAPDELAGLMRRFLGEPFPAGSAGGAR